MSDNREQRPNGQEATPPSVSRSAAAHVGGEKPRPLPRKFYSQVAVEAVDSAGSAFRVLLDGRRVRTPAKHELTVPTRALADAVAAEWQAQADVIDPATMPLTRLVNTALDGVAGRETQVRDDIANYLGSDLVCYLADGPPDLVERQKLRWGPIQRWLGGRLGRPLALSSGIRHVAQAPELLSAMSRELSGLDAFALAALHVMTTLTGSAALAFACATRHIGVDEAWSLAHLDEDWQIETWGEDHEARRRRDLRGVEMRAAARLLALTGGPGPGPEPSKSVAI